MVVRGELRACDTSKMVLFFRKIIYSLNLLTIFARSSILRSVTGCWIWLGYFFRFPFIKDLFLLLTFLNIDGTTTLHTKLDNRDTTTISVSSFGCFDFLWKIFALFLGTFIVDFEYYLFIVSTTFWHIFAENQKGVILMGGAAKH